MLEDFHAQPARDRVIVALDCDAATALCLAVQLRGRHDAVLCRGS